MCTYEVYKPTFVRHGKTCEKTFETISEYDKLCEEAGKTDGQTNKDLANGLYNYEQGN